MPGPATPSETASLSVEELAGDPHAALARLRAREPVACVPALGGWLVTRYDVAVGVLRDAERFTVQDERFTTAQVVGPSMLSLDGGDHDRHRAPFTQPFRPGPVREHFTREVQAMSAALVDGLAAAGGAEVLSEFAGPLAAGMLARALGLAPAEAAVVRRWYESIAGAVTELTAGQPLPPSGREAYRQLADRLAPLAEMDADARHDPGGGLLARAHAAAGDTLSVDELLSNAAVLLFGGIETTEAMIANALLMVLRDPDVLAAVRPTADTIDETMLDRAIEESLRLEPAAALLDRYATVDVELAGARVRAGDLVRVSIAAANRDPAVFPAPDRLTLEPPRPPRHLAFAHGPHVCLGVHLARLETRVALRDLLTRLPGLTLAPGASPVIQGLVFRKPSGLRVKWRPARLRA